MRKKLSLEFKMSFEKEVPKLQAEKKLVERLELHDQNQNFHWSLPLVVPEAPEVDDWPSSGFSSITEKDRGKVPQIMKEDVEDYAINRQALDNLANQYITSLKKASLMKEDQIKALNFCTIGEKDFFTCLVSTSINKYV